MEIHPIYMYIYIYSSYTERQGDTERERAREREASLLTVNSSQVANGFAAESSDGNCGEISA